MGYREDDKYIIYPLYFDEMLSRKNGRRVPKNLAVEKPTVEDIAKAAKNLNLHPIIEKESSHSARHWKKEGRILIDKKDTKQTLLNQIAKVL
jgi:signal recognition particle subunit SRP19